MNEKKYKLVDISNEEKEEFMKKLFNLLEENSIYFEPVPQFIRDTIDSPWKIVTQVFLQKKVQIEEVEVKKEEESVVSPIQNEDLSETA